MLVQIDEVKDKLEQFRHENQTWSKSLDFYKQENAFLKNRLSQVVDKTFGQDFLAQAEHFQNQFIIKDEFMDELKHEVNAQRRVLEEKYIVSGFSLDEQVSKKQMNLREQIEFLEKDFSALRNEFIAYLGKIL
jgi:hypothetical protein